MDYSDSQIISILTFNFHRCPCGPMCESGLGSSYIIDDEEKELVLLMKTTPKQTWIGELDESLAE